MLWQANPIKGNYSQNYFMDKEAMEPETPEAGNEPEEIPKHRSFNLYGMLICGIIISITGVYLKLSSLDQEPSLYFDGDNFRFAAIDGLYYIVTGIIICIFPAWHLYKGNHKTGKRK